MRLKQIRGVDVIGKNTMFLNFQKNMAKNKWELRTYFSTKTNFKEVGTIFVVQSGRDLKFAKKDKQMVRVICKKGC